MSSDPLRKILLPTLFLLASCSVKEDRTSCPCALVLELSSLPASPVVLGAAGEGFSCTEVVHSDTLLVLPVPKTSELDISAVGGALAEGDGSIRIPEGEEAPPLYLFHATVSTVAEQVTVPVLLRKEFCRLELIFTGPSGYGPPFEVEVEGSFCGWLPDGRPAPGLFSHRLLPGSDGHAALRLPRQGDDSLLMHIVFSDQVVRTFALGYYIGASGYDWTDPDLEDLTLHVDISVTSVTISTDLWEITQEIELFI